MKLPHEWSADEVADVADELVAQLRAAGRPVVETSEGTYVAAGTVVEQIDLLAEVLAGIRRAVVADHPEAAAVLAWSLAGGAQILYRAFADEAAARAN